jgi:hypothetical protein
MNHNGKRPLKGELPPRPRPLVPRGTVRPGWSRCGGGWRRRRHKSAAL